MKVNIYYELVPEEYVSNVSVRIRCKPSQRWTIANDIKVALMDSRYPPLRDVTFQEDMG